jgi:hypothetical protein
LFQASRDRPHRIRVLLKLDWRELPTAHGSSPIGWASATGDGSFLVIALAGNL